jgi:hypothetical protein
MVDGIYLRWSTFIMTILNHVLGEKKTWFAQQQEIHRKDVERAVGVKIRCERS